MVFLKYIIKSIFKTMKLVFIMLKLVFETPKPFSPDLFDRNFIRYMGTVIALPIFKISTASILSKDVALTTLG